MAEDNGGKVQTLAIWLTIGVAIIGGGIWVGQISEQVNANNEWIRQRNGISIDSRLAVIEIKLGQLNDHILSVDQSLQRHMAEERGR